MSEAAPDRMKILFVETLYLGDLVHSLPLLQAVRARFPDAELHLLVRAGNAALLQGYPGIDRLWLMEPTRHRGLGGLLALTGALRRERYALVLNPGASDRASLITALSGGALRLGRLNRRGMRWLWQRLHDEVLDYPYFAEPMWWQKLQAFRERLQLPAAAPDFRLEPLARSVMPPELPERYIHLSPCASEDLRSLPPATVLALVQQLRRRFPQFEVVISAGPGTRERRRLELLGGFLRADGVRLFAGTLDLPRLLAVLRRAALHIGPDSGPLHLAHALGTPAVGCFLYKDGSAEWQPLGPAYRTVGTCGKLQGGLYALDTERVLAAAAELLAPA